VDVRITIAFSFFLLTGCATAPAPQSEFCAIAEPIRLTDSEWAALSVESRDMVLRHDVAGERLCGW
jgi:hypothetical protein